MLSSVIGGALVLGFAGSLHCTAMCGSLSVAGCSARGRPSLRAALAYFGGRIVTYSFVGAVFGAFGGALDRGAFTGARTVLVFVAALSLIWKGVRLFSSNPELVRIGASRPLLPIRLPSRGLALGLLTGVLPCGLLFAGWGLAASSGTPVSGALVMLALSISTLPGLLAPVVLHRSLARIPALARPALQGAVWCVLGVWLASRPLFEMTGGSCHG